MAAAGVKHFEGTHSLENACKSNKEARCMTSAQCSGHVGVLACTAVLQPVSALEVQGSK